MHIKHIDNNCIKGIILNSLIAFISLIFNGLGCYLTIHANIGSAPWDVLNQGVSYSTGMLFGNASIIISFAILAIDIIMKEPIGIAMIIDAITVGKSVDFFNFIDIIPIPKSLIGSLVMTFIGLFIMGYTQYFYMSAALGCGPRDTLMVGLSKRIRKVKIGFVSIFIQSVVTFVGYILGGKVGIGTLICAFCSGPIMQFAFDSMHFDATRIVHQNIKESFEIMVGVGD